MAEAGAAAVAPEMPARSLWSDAWGRLRRDRAAMVAVGVLGAVTLLALLGPWLSPHDIERPDWTAIAVPPGSPYAHWLGTDRLGRDLYMRTLEGIRLSMAIGLLATAVSLVIGV